MIPHTSAGVQQWGHPLRPLNSGAGRVDTSQHFAQADFQLEKLPMSGPPQPQPRQPAVIDLTANGGDAQEREPPAKRLRLELPSGPSTSVGSPVPGSGGEPRSTPGIPPASKSSSLSWRGRPVWSFQALVSEIPGNGEMSEEDAASVAQSGKPASPPPFPVLPWKYAPPDSSNNKPSKSRDSSPVKKVQTTPYHIECPTIAPVLKGEKVADFSPWAGNHSEDVLNEQTAKQGHYDRTQVSQNESNTARPSLYAQLKHRSGLHMLSSVFATALEKRQSHNLVTAPSTFKPPPRVTLTDNKREAWLRDLSNPSVPLRKLSRTIPHGIRGKVLLDQCLSKWIPVNRAVWLAKCVGANEIRAFKRKGTSGAVAVGLEAKWVRDWTLHVQQFLEGMIAACGAADWKKKMTYAVGLTARLFFERLLDHDQYLGWFLSSLEAAPLNTVPVWLLMLGIYWDKVMQYRKRGRRLAEALLEKLRQVSQPEYAMSLRPLVDRLSLYIKKLVLEHTSSVVLPSSWDKYKDLVSSCLDMKDNTHKSIFQNIAERNARVQLSNNRQETAQRSASQRVIHLFDSIRATHDISSTSIACLKMMEDKALLVSKLLEWTATPFRSGLCRVYTGVRLLRKWKTSGVDIDTFILSFLGHIQGGALLSMDNIYHVISELVRSQTFSVGRYLQWLMAKGVPRSDQPEFPGDLYLLKQLPTSRLPEHVRNLRNTLLHRAGITVSMEDSTIAELKASIAQRLPNIFGDELEHAMSVESPQLDLTWAVKSEIGQWLRRGVAGHCQSSFSKFSGVSLSSENDVSTLTPDEFYKIREILEEFGDLSMLADVVKQATNCDNNIVLASAADTVNYHFDSFCVIGATPDLFKGLVESYARLKRLGTPGLDLVFSLIELGLRLPHEFNTVALLRQDLSRIESKSALAAPSPLSDNPSSTFNDSDPSFRMKLDQLLSSGGAMDESTMDSIFSSLTNILAGSNDTVKLSENETCRYLAYLRPFHPKHFDAMLVRWIFGLLKSPARCIMSRILPPLIGVGCVTIHAFVFLVKKLLLSDKVAAKIPSPANLRRDLLELLVPPSPGRSGYSDLVTYRFHLAQQEFLVKHYRETLDVIRDAVSTDIPGERGSDCVDATSSAVILLRFLLTQEPEGVVQCCLQKIIGQHSASAMVLQKALDLLLGFDPSQDPQMSEAEKVIHMTDDFSLPFCQLKLQVLFNAELKGKVGDGIVDVMFKAAVADTRAKGSNWVGLVSLMSRDAVQQIRERAEKEFFSIPLFEETLVENSCPTTADNSQALETAKLYLTIIEKLAYSIPESGVQAVTSLLVEKMDLLLHKLVIMQTNYNIVTATRQGSSSSQVSQARANFERALAFWFSALLRMIILHRAAFSSPTLGTRGTGVPDQTRLLISIFCISLARLPDNVLRLYPAADYFPHPIPSEGYRPCPGILLQTHALDVAACLIDTFQDEARQQCARFLRDKCPPFLQFQDDSRFQYLLGPIPEVGSSNVPPPASLPSPAAAAASTPTPTPSSNLPASSSSQAPVTLSGIPNCVSEDTVAGRLRLQYRGRIIGPYPVRPWELLEDAAPIVGANDTAVNLKYFDTRRVRV
ncbi:RNA polymerase II mediator complex subunit [Aspergillus nanangensis]|uniref:Mediator of RNA polymerase II transcription subunit 12 n=1 Tax=Aspergillus nanangensis TaxID=2582783 RepID=A0AAD4CMD6_ASPNN|nr:RNA polymerase II mediator complex subunit [Aspergillus nanangensis]